MTRHWLVFMLLTGIPLQAISITPATPVTREQILCNSTHIVVGEIIETDIKCHMSQWGGRQECKMLLAAKIAKVIATARSIRIIQMA